MEFSSEWRSPWPISASFSAPSLLLPSPNLGPLLFTPSSLHAPSTLLSSPSLFPNLPPPPSNFHPDLLSFFHSFPLHFIPSSSAQSLLLPSPAPPFLPNSLRALPSRRHPHLLLFFPLGDNAHRLGYFALSSTGEFIGDLDGDVFQQPHGFRHPSHRIIHIAVRPADPDTDADSDLESHLLAVTMYSVNWFRVKSTERQPVLVPMKKQGFMEPVTCACWNPHFAEESAVLLESGKVVVVDLDAGHGFTVDVSMDGKLGVALACEFGGQPWNLIVVGSKCVAVVDLRCGDSTEPVVLARIDCSDTYLAVHSMEDDVFLAFCRADFDPLYFSVATRYHLLLFDMRQPLSPLLTWDHGISSPSYVGMYKLSDLRSLQGDGEVRYPEGYTILVGSLWEDEFKLFCYGLDDEKGYFGPTFRAWDLPSRISLSGADRCLGDDVLEEELFKEDVPDGIEWQEKKDLLLGFYICPRSYWDSDRGCEETNGFDLIRLVSSGKLELQKYCASWDKSNENSGDGRPPLSKADVSLFHYGKDVDLPSHYVQVMKMNFLKSYFEGDLYGELAKHIDTCKVRSQESKRIAFNSVLWELIRDKIRFLASQPVTDVTFPASMHEVACRRVLVSLQSSLLYLSFSRYRDLFSRRENLALEFFEVPEALANRAMPPILTAIPSRRSMKWTHDVRPGDALLGPILPLPVALMLEQIVSGNQSGEELLSEQCNKVRRTFFPEISLADDFDFSDPDAYTVPKAENSFFTHEVFGGSSSKLVKDGRSLGTFEDPNFTTFVTGMHRIHGHEPLERACLLDMLDDISLVNVGYNSPDMKFSADEERIYKCLGKQFLKWHGSKFSSYQDLCTSKKINGRSL